MTLQYVHCTVMLRVIFADWRQCPLYSIEFTGQSCVRGYGVIDHLFHLFLNFLKKFAEKAVCHKLVSYLQWCTLRVIIILRSLNMEILRYRPLYRKVPPLPPHIPIRKQFSVGFQDRNKQEDPSDWLTYIVFFCFFLTDIYCTYACIWSPSKELKFAKRLKQMAQIRQ